MKFMEYSEVTCGHRSGVASICAFWGVVPCPCPRRTPHAHFVNLHLAASFVALSWSLAVFKSAKGFRVSSCRAVTRLEMSTSRNIALSNNKTFLDSPHIYCIHPPHPYQEVDEQVHKASSYSPYIHLYSYPPIFTIHAFPIPRP